MSWAARRRLLIVATIVVFGLIVAAIALYASFYHAPSCIDGSQNQGEQGIDCGGPCPYLCSSEAQAPVVRFTQALAPVHGRSDIIAYIDNPNLEAYARGVSYQVTFYAADHTLAAPSASGTLDLPPGATVPVFLPDINSGNATITAAFLAIDQSSLKWQAGRDMRITPSVSTQVVGGTLASPRITATLTNPNAKAITDIRVVVAAYDAAGNVIAASQTIVPSIPGQGSTSATFTWDAPFSAPVARVEVIPVIGL